jgi:hypothetical protein
LIYAINPERITPCALQTDGVGVHEGVEGLVVLWLRGADRVPALNASDDQFFAPIDPKRPFEAQMPNFLGPLAKMMGTPALPDAHGITAELQR